MNTVNAVLKAFGVRVLVTVGWTAALVSVVGSLLVWGSRGFEPQPLSFAHGIAGGLAIATGALVFASVGAVLAVRLPRNAIGWLLLVFGIFLGFLPPINLLVGEARQVFRPVPQTTLALAWLYSSFLTPTCWVIAVLVGLLFPNGRPLSRRWWAAGLMGASGAGLMAMMSAVSPDGLLWYPSLPNPLSMSTSLHPIICGGKVVGLALLVGGMGLAVVSSALRYRDGNEETRHQLHWFVLAGVILALTAAPFGAARYAFQASEALGEVLLVVVLAGACLTPLAVAAAIMRYRLFGLEVFIGHTLVYIPLTGILGGLYAASVALFQRLFVSLTGNTSDVAIVISTLILAAVFTPMRKSLEGHVDRRFKSQAGSVLAAGAAVEPGTAHPALADEAIIERLDELEAEVAHLRGQPSSEASGRDKRLRRWRRDPGHRTPQAIAAS